MNPADPATLPLRDIHLPPPVPWWPPAPGWWVLAGALVLLVAVVGWLWLSHRRHRLRRAALAELAAIETALAAGGDRHASARRLSLLLRRITLATGDSGAASRTGQDWLTALTADGRDPLPARLEPVLLEAPYSPARAERIERGDFDAVAAHVRTWLTQTPLRERRRA